jgi:hypothetical protein
MWSELARHESYKGIGMETASGEKKILIELILAPPDPKNVHQTAARSIWLPAMNHIKG